MSRHDWPVELDALGGCWLWQGRFDREGYPMLRDGGRAHRRIYEAEVGAVPDGLELDHTCRVRKCVAPHHMEPVTRSENELRKALAYRLRLKKCPRGHELSTLTRIALPTGGFACRTCKAQ